jgi:hypothetical protein
MQEKPFREAMSLITGRIDEAAAGEAKLASCELGYILDDYSLKLDRLKTPLKDYLVAHYLTLQEPDFTQTETACGHCPHDHQVKTPQQLYHLHPGDRVLAVPVNGQQDFVVVARVMPKETLMAVV